MVGQELDMESVPKLYSIYSELKSMDAENL